MCDLLSIVLLGLLIRVVIIGHLFVGLLTPLFLRLICNYKDILKIQ